MKRNTGEMLGTAPIGRVIFSLALPALAANLINCLYNVVDRMYIGRIEGVGTAALTGVGVTFPIIMLITAFANFAGGGGAPLAGIYLGSGEKAKADNILSNSFFLLLIFGVSLTALFQLFKEPLLYLFGASDAVIGYSLEYMSTYLMGTLFVQMAIGLNPFISTQGRSGIAMCSVLVGAVLNIVLDPIFIFVLDMGVRGAALASIISQGVSAAWVLHFLMSKNSGLRLRFARPSGKILGRIASLGLAPFIMGSTESLVTIVLNSGMQRYGGDLYVASITILQSILQLIIIPLQSFSQGTQPLISYNYGAGNYKRVREAFRWVLTICMSLSMVMGLACTLFTGTFARMFTSDDLALIELCGRAGRIFFVGMTIFGAQMACQASFLGLGQAKASLFAAMLRKVFLMVPLAILLPILFNGDPTAIYFSEPISDAVASAVTLCVYLVLRRKLLPVDRKE